MVLIEVDKRDTEKAFEILSNNGRFVGISETKYSIIDNEEEVLQKLTDKGIKFKKIEQV